MSKKEQFDNIITNFSKYETRIENYLINPKEKPTDQEQSKFLAFREPTVEIQDPKVSTWVFMDKKSLENFLFLKKKIEIRKYLDSKAGHIHPKGKGRIMFVELMYNTTKFCKKSNFDLEKTGALLSQFYLTHLFFTNKFDMSTEKVYIYFKDLTMCHSLPFPPGSTKIYSHKEAKEIMELFCKLYLRNIPLIRFLSLPNFGFYLNYELEPEPALGKGKGKKGK